MTFASSSSRSTSRVSGLWSLVLGLSSLVLAVSTAAQTIYVPGGTLGTSNGDAGVGTSTPAAKLDVEGLIDANGSYGNSQRGVIFGGGNGGSGNTQLNVFVDNTNSRVVLNSVKQGVGYVPLTLQSEGGNVGIGTTSPAGNLHVAGNGSAHIRIDSLNSGSPYLGFYQANSERGYLQYSEQGATDYLDIQSDGNIYLNPAGNVGIGTSSPIGKLHVVGGSVYTGTIIADGPTSGYSAFGLYENGSYKASIYWHPGIAAATFYGPSTWFFESGGVGIGTANIGSYKLAVEGAIRARSVVVDSATWPDYVFGDSYQLSALSDVEQFIKEKKHLPGIPSAAEVKAGGVSLGDMQSRLLAKVEELTLHAIAQEKRHIAQEKLNDELRTEVATLRAQLAQLSTHH